MISDQQHPGRLCTLCVAFCVIPNIVWLENRKRSDEMYAVRRLAMAELVKLVTGYCITEEVSGE